MEWQSFAICVGGWKTNPTKKNYAYLITFACDSLQKVSSLGGGKSRIVRKASEKKLCEEADLLRMQNIFNTEFQKPAFPAHSPKPFGILGFFQN